MSKTRCYNFSRLNPTFSLIATPRCGVACKRGLGSDAEEKLQHRVFSLLLMNNDLVTIFTEMAELLAMKEVPFKPRAFEKAALAISELSESVGDIYKKGGLAALEEISGVGRGIAERIEEYIKTGRIKDYDQLKKKMPVRVEELTRIEGVGPKMIKTLYEKLGIRTLRHLETAARAGKIAKLPRFGKKSEEKILKSIAFLKQSGGLASPSQGGRMPIGEALPLAREIKARLEKVEGVERCEIAGSLRRWQETIGDIDLLAVSSKPEKVTEAFVHMPGVKGIHARGETKSSVRLKQNIDADLRVVPKESFGAALQYFTGNKAHNVALRKIATEKGYKLNEYGLFKLKVQSSKAKTIVAGKTEEEIYEALGLQYIEPEMRLDEGEIGLAKYHKLPKLVDYGDLKGDLQTQTNWTDGADSIEEMARVAYELGHEYIAITDHTRGLAMTGGADEAKLLKQIKEIEKINHKLSASGGKIENCKLKILSGAEVNIKKDGSLDIDDETLAKLDVVGAAIHSHFKLSKKEQTARLIAAIENPHVDIIFHPTARIVMRREPIEVDMEQVLKAAALTGTAMEINAHPWRLDLSDEHIRLALKLGVALVIDTDAHSVAELGYLEYGVAQARRAGATKKDILNTKPLREFLQALK